MRGDRREPRDRARDRAPLCDEGGRVLLVGRDAEALSEAAAGCGGASTSPVDVTDPEADERIIATCAEQMGGVDVLVNNAGTSFARSLDELTDADWQGQWDLHVMAPMRLMRAAAPRMAERGRRADRQRLLLGRQAPVADERRLRVTKAAQLSLSRVFADATPPTPCSSTRSRRGRSASRSVDRRGGLGDQTARAKGITREEALEAQTAKVPLGRFAKPAEIADVIVFLCSARAPAT